MSQRSKTRKQKQKRISYSNEFYCNDDLGYSFCECDTNLIAKRFCNAYKIKFTNTNENVINSFENLRKEERFTSIKSFIPIFGFDISDINGEKIYNIFVDKLCQIQTKEFISKGIFPLDEIKFIIKDFVDILSDLDQFETNQILLNDITLVMKRNYLNPFPRIKLSPLAFVLPLLYKESKMNSQFDYKQDIINIIQQMFKEIKDKESLTLIQTFISLLKENKSIKEILTNQLIQQTLTDCELQFEDINNYELLESIGKGGFGVVRKGYRKNDETKKIIAIKEVEGEGINLSQLISEAIILKMAHHSNIPQFISLAEDKEETFDKCTYLIMELCDTDLFKYINELKRKNVSIQFETKCQIIQQICKTMYYIHYELGLVNRDIKLQNILINKPIDNTSIPIVKITDFGLTRGNAEIISTYCCTEKFAAPELGMKKEIYDDTVDIFSLGLCFYELFFGKCPMDEDNNFMMKIEKGMILEFDEVFMKDEKYFGIIELLKKMIVKKSERYSWNQFFEDKFIKQIYEMK